MKQAANLDVQPAAAFGTQMQAGTWDVQVNSHLGLQQFIQDA